MKVRVIDNEIRFRVRRPEVASLAAGESLRVSLALVASGGSWSVLLRSDAASSHVQLQQRRDEMIVSVPASLMRSWLADEACISLDLVAPGRVRVLLEKDFPCLHDPEADNVGTYPRPKR